MSPRFPSVFRFHLSALMSLPVSASRTSEVSVPETLPPLIHACCLW